MYAIEIKGLSKSFKNLKAVDDLSFSVKAGELFAFLGVNGAGKSTTINVICGILERDAGEVTILGVPLDESDNAIRKALGIVYQGTSLDQALSVRDNLIGRGALYGMSKQSLSARIEELSRVLDMGEILDRPFGKLSGGQKRKADLARAILHKPKILILDEPTTGLDPMTRRTVWQVIDDLRKEEGMTVFLTTHDMEEAAEADTVVIIDGGKIVAQGSPYELKTKYTGDFISLYGVTAEQAEALGLSAEPIADGVRVKVPSTKHAAALIARHPELFGDFEIVKGKMDDVFLTVTGKTLMEETHEHSRRTR